MAHVGAFFVLFTTARFAIVAFLGNLLDDEKSGKGAKEITLYNYHAILKFNVFSIAS